MAVRGRRVLLAELLGGVRRLFDRVATNAAHVLARVAIATIVSAIATTAPVAAPLSSTEIAALAAPARGKVGVAGRIVESGESFSLSASDRFPMQSVYKFPIGMAVLAEVDRGALALDRVVAIESRDLVYPGQYSPIRDRFPDRTQYTVEELVRAMVSESDSTACDALLRLIGGPSVVMRFLRSIGIDGIRVADRERAMGRNRQLQYRNHATPDAMVALLIALNEGRGLSRPSRDRILRWMTESTTGPNRLKKLLPAGTVVAHKTGTGGTWRGVAPATNDVGIIILPDLRHLAIAVFVSDAHADMDVREHVIAQIAKAAWERSVR